MHKMDFLLRTGFGRLRRGYTKRSGGVPKLTMTGRAARQSSNDRLTHLVKMNLCVSISSRICLCGNGEVFYKTDEHDSNLCHIAHMCDWYDFGNNFKGVDDPECDLLRFTPWRVEMEDMINRENRWVWVRQG